MKPEDAQRDRQALEIFSRAVEMTSAEVRKGYLEGACGGDERLKARVEALLAHHVQDSFLQQPAAVLGPGATVLRPVTEKPGDRIGRYKLLEQIGEGGCGVVYVAEQEEPIRRRVALKVIKLGMDTQSVIARFEAERQALALMDHPNIAKVLDAGATETGRPFFVMELVRGIKITGYCDQNNLSTRERLDLFIQVCHAIQHAHQKGIIHRDIKPSNILVTLHDGVPVPKVIDFGIAKATTQQRLTDKTVYTAFEQFIGTPAYMSPEQAEMSGLDIDTRSDIYALGVLLYELLTGKTPFDPKTLLAMGLAEMRRIIREQEPARPSTRLGTMVAGELTTTAEHRHAEVPKLIHQVQGDLDWIVMKALEKDRARRYETANGLALDVECHLKHEPVVARPPSTAYRVQKFVRRNKLMVTAGAAVATALVVGTIVSTWQAIEARTARNAEQGQRLAAQTERDKAQAAQKEAEQSQQAEQQARLRADRLLYVANMNVAQLAWDQNNIGRLRQVLEDTQESPYRGFEWYYWQPKAHLALKTLRGHLRVVSSVAFSPDGQRIVTGSYDQTAKVWEVASGRELLTLKGHRRRIFSVAFSPDGQRIITGSDTAKVWEAASGRELLTLYGHSDAIGSVGFSPDGQRIVTGSVDKTAKVWEAASGRELLTLQGHSDLIQSVAFSPDGQRIVTGSDDQTAKVWEAASGRELLTLQRHSGAIWSAAFSPDGQRIVTGSRDHTAKVWEAADGRELLTLQGHSGPIVSVAYSLDGQRIVTGSEDNTAKVWEAADGRELLTLKGHSDGIESVAFSPDGQRIVTASDDQTAKMWEVAKGLSADKTGENLLTLKGHSHAIWSVSFSPDGQRIVTGSWDATAKVWKATNGEELLTLKGHSGWIWSVAFSPDGQRIVTGSEDRTAKVWEAASGKELLTLEGHGVPITSVAFSPDGQRIVTGSGYSWTGGGDQTAMVWEAASGRELLTLKGHSERISSVAFSPDGQRIVTGSRDQTAKVWEAASGRELLTLKGHSEGISSVAFSPDGQRIITGSGDRTAKVWEAASGRELLTLKGHSGVIGSVVFSPDGQRIVTGSYDRTARVWEAASGRELLTLKAHSDMIESVAFSPDGQRIVTGSDDRTARIWEAARAEQVAVWQQEERAAAQSLAALQREQTAEQERQRIASARDSIKQWLLLAPIPLATGQSGAEGLDLEQIEGEGGLRPKAGKARSIGGGDLKWREVALTNEVIDFNATLGQVTTQSVAYLVCYLRSEAAQGGLQMLVGSDDEAKVYLNGKEVYKCPFPRSFYAEQDKVPDIALNAGLNVLVFKVVNETEDWQGSIRFTDAQGNPVKGIKMTLNPDAKD
jgi:WD40 repeat protein